MAVNRQIHRWDDCIKLGYYQIVFMIRREQTFEEGQSRETAHSIALIQIFLTGATPRTPGPNQSLPSAGDEASGIFDEGPGQFCRDIILPTGEVMSANGKDVAETSFVGGDIIARRASAILISCCEAVEGTGALSLLKR